MLEFFVRLQSLLTVQREKGATAVEYGLMVALIAGAIVLMVTALGVSVGGLFTSIAGIITANTP